MAYGDEENSESTCVDLNEGDQQYLTGSNNNNRYAKDRNSSSSSSVEEIRELESAKPPMEIRSYGIRYFLLLLFISLSMTNAFQWIEYAIIESYVTQFWNVDTFWVNCTSTVYMASYILGIVPATWLLDKFGLRPCLIVASLGNAVGSWVKCLSVNPHYFWVSMVGQTIVATSQLFILNIPPLLAATWFPAEGVTKATAYGVFGNQVGIALGFLIPPMLMPHEAAPAASNTSTTTIASVLLNQTSAAVDSTSTFDIEGTGRGLRFLFYGVSIITSVIFLLIIAFFESKPQLPPSEAQFYAQTLNHEQSFSSSIISLFTNANFLLLFLSYGLNTGVFYAISTVLSQMISNAIGGGFVQEGGMMGLTITLAGIVGSIVCGYILSCTKQFKGVTLFVYVFSLVGTIAFTTGLIIKSIWLLFIVSGLLGFFMTGYLPIGFEFAAEVSYPQPEGTSAGLLNAAAQIFGIIFTFSSSAIIENYGHLQANLCFIGALIVGVILTVLVKSDLRRQNAHLSNVSSDQAAEVPANFRRNSVTVFT